MIRIVLGGLLRLLLWFVAFYLVVTVVRAVIRALFPSSRPMRRQDDSSASAQGAPAKRPEEYGDVKDARFSDVSPKDNSASSHD